LNKKLGNNQNENKNYKKQMGFKTRELNLELQPIARKSVNERKNTINKQKKTYNECQYRMNQILM